MSVDLVVAIQVACASFCSFKRCLWVHPDDPHQAMWSRLTTSVSALSSRSQGCSCSLTASSVRVGEFAAQLPAAEMKNACPYFYLLPELPFPEDLPKLPETLESCNKTSRH